MLRIVLTALLIDILAFTIILPLFPRLVEYYHLKSVYIDQIRNIVGQNNPRMDIILFGGLVGSLFSFLQFLSSPWIGWLSDKYGRRPVLLVSMLGNALSMLFWVFASTWDMFLMSRIVGGLTEGNVQLSIAMITDLTDEASRSRSLAWVGISFALGFTFGPPLGAYLTTINVQEYFPYLPLYPFSAPALFALLLIVVESVYMYLYLPETKKPGVAKTITTQKEKRIKKEVDRKLWYLGLVHFAFLFLFSGMEFTLTFLTFDRFGFTNGSQGQLLAFVGICSALVQGGYVRRVAHKSVSEATLVMQGIASCAIGLFMLGNFAYSTILLYAGSFFMAFTSGTVVTCLTALASLTQKKNEKKGDENIGETMGRFRSMGQLGRCLGPIVACSAYWMLGSQQAYTLASLVMLGILVAARQALN